MSEGMSISEFLRYLTVKISTAPTGVGTWTSSGTGFFFTFEKNGFQIPAIITNKHVLAGAGLIGLQLHEAGTDGKPLAGSGKPLNFSPNQTLILQHPDDQVDLAAILVAPLIAAAKSEFGWEPSYSHLIAANLPTPAEWAAFMTIEDLLMIGYPNGLYDGHNNTAVARRGISASPLGNNYQGKQEFLIDMAVFGGSSGSPIIIANEGSYAQADGLFIGNRFYLLGVLYGGHYLNAAGTIIAEPAPTQLSPQVKVMQMIHLGLCVKSNRLLEFIDLIPVADPESTAAPPAGAA